MENMIEIRDTPSDNPTILCDVSNTLLGAGWQNDGLIKQLNEAESKGVNVQLCTAELNLLRDESARDEAFKGESGGRFARNYRSDLLSAGLSESIVNNVKGKRYAGLVMDASVVAIIDDEPDSNMVEVAKKLNPDVKTFHPKFDSAQIQEFLRQIISSQDKGRELH